MTVRSASAVILVGGKFAMQLRDRNIAVSPGCWGLFGGGIEPGESSLQALVRELREELELEIAVDEAEYLGEYGPCRYFVVDATEQWSRTVLHEGQAAMLFDLEDVLELPLNNHTRTAIELHLGVERRRPREVFEPGCAIAIFGFPL